MSSYSEAVARKEKAIAVAKQASDPITCPMCENDLDTGYECTGCGFDATPTLEGKIGGALETYDEVVRGCPANTSYLGDRDCPKCGAMRDEGCRNENRAAYTFIEQVRAYLADTVRHGDRGRGDA